MTKENRTETLPLEDPCALRPLLTLNQATGSTDPWVAFNKHLLENKGTNEHNRLDSYTWGSSIKEECLIFFLA